MREQHLVAVELIAGHKEPAGQSFSDIAARVGQGSIVGLYGITKQASQQSDALIDCLLQLLCGNAIGGTFNLHEDVAWRAIGAVDHRKPTHPCAPNNRDLSLPSLKPATATTEAMPLSGNYTSLIDLFDDCNRCRNLSGTASRCGCRRARSVFDMALRMPLRCTLASTVKTIAWSIEGGFNPICGTHRQFDPAAAVAFKLGLVCMARAGHRRCTA